MRDVSKNELLAMLEIIKNPEDDYNANSLSKLIGITPMGMLKILKKLEAERLLVSKKIGKAVIYKLNFESDYAMKYAEFAFKRESEQSHLFVKRWVNDVARMNNALAAVIFGSVLSKREEAKDIDVLFIVNQINYKKLLKEVDEFNKISLKKIHPIYQSPDDMKNNIRKRDEVILNALKGIVAKGEKEILEALK